MSAALTATSIRPEPTAEEAAAIVAACDALWPRPVEPPPPSSPTGWRFSGRWWVPGGRPLRSR